MNFKKIIDDCARAVGNNNSPEFERKVVDVINGLDFSDPQITIEGEEYLKLFVNDRLCKNLEISRIESKVANMIIAKRQMAKNGVEGSKICFRPRTSEDGNTGAYYSDIDKTITFFDDPYSDSSVCNSRMLKPYGKTVEAGALSRANQFNRFAYIICHEVQHAVQFNNKIEDPYKLSCNDYIMYRQAMARVLSEINGTKYASENIYLKNHNEFLYELDADAAGFSGALELAEKISPYLYEIATNSKVGNNMLTKLDQKQQILEDYNNVTWDHSTNPNQKPVRASHKASLIVDEVLSLYNKQDLPQLFELFPTLALTHNMDGSKKTLIEVEKDRKAKIKAVDSMDMTPAQKSIEKSRLIEFFDMVIESDATLCFERQLQRVVRTEHGLHGFMSDGGTYVKRDEENVYAEIREAGEKAKEIASYMEGVNYNETSKIFKKYRKEAMSMPILSHRDQELYNAKKYQLFGVEVGIHYNADLTQAKLEKDQREKKTREAREYREKRALQVLKGVFPEFTPQPKLLKGTSRGMELVQNNIDAMILIEGLNNYIYNSMLHGRGRDFIHPSIVNTAIRTLFPDAIPVEEKNQFNEGLRRGEIKPIRNILDPVEVKESGPAQAQMVEEQVVEMQNEPVQESQPQIEQEQPEESQLEEMNGEAAQVEKVSMEEINSMQEELGIKKEKEIVVEKIRKENTMGRERF